MRQYPYGTARALLAFQRGEQTELGIVGALLWAEHIDNTRALASFVKAFAKGSGGKTSKRGGIRRKRR